MNKFDFIDWPATVAKYGYKDKAAITGNHPVIVRCTICTIEMEYKVSSIRKNHGKQFNPVCHSCGQKSVWSSPSYKTNQSTIHSKLTTKQWDDPDYREKVKLGLRKAHSTIPGYTSIAIAAMQQSPEKRILAISQKYKSDPTYRTKLSTISKARWQDPIYRQLILDKLGSIEVRKKISAKVKKAWEKPEYAKAILSNNKSKLEEHLAAILDDIQIPYERQYCLGHWPFDFCIPYSNKNILIEVNGEYWHGARFQHNRDRDQAKATFIERYHSNTHELRILWEHEFLSPDRIQFLISSWFNKQPPIVEYSFSDLTIEIASACDANLFLTKYHHTASGGRNGINIIVKHGNTIIAVAKFCSPTRMESAVRLKLKTNELMELTRFAIHPSYQKHNLASWFLARCYKLIPRHVKKLITFADTTYGHTGHIYKASNWILDGIIPADYFYKDNNGFIMHKKTMWSQAKKMGANEYEYALLKGYEQCMGGEKYRFIYDLK